jgi:hypothetical protein
MDEGKKICYACILNENFFLPVEEIGNQLPEPFGAGFIYIIMPATIVCGSVVVKASYKCIVGC